MDNGSEDDNTGITPSLTIVGGKSWKESVVRFLQFYYIFDVSLNLTIKRHKSLLPVAFRVHVEPHSLNCNISPAAHCPGL